MTEESKLAWEVEGISLVWIAVKNLEAAIKFYTEVVGLTLQEHNSEYKWAELAGPAGAILGIAEENPEMEIQAGSNAVVSIHVSDIEAARNSFIEKGARLIGEVIEVPGHVKMQTVMDADGNMLQLAEMIGM